MRPRLLAPGRGWPLARLGVLTLAEAGALAGGVVALKRFLDAAGAGADLRGPSLMLLAVSTASAVITWARAVTAEDVSMDYANDLRRFLARHAVAASEGARRLGALTARMTGDVNPMREWASIGLGESGAALAAGVGALAALGMAAGAGGLAAGVGLLAACGLVWIGLGRAHRRALQRLRQARGRVAAVAGDIVLGARTLALFHAAHRERTRLDARADDVRAAAVRRTAIASLVEAPAAYAVVATFLAMLSLAMHADRAIDWAMAAFAGGFLGAALRSGARARDSFLAAQLGAARFDRLAAEAARVRTDPARAPAPSDGAIALRLGGGDDVVLQRGEVAFVSGELPRGALASLESLARTPGAVRFAGAQDDERGLRRRIMLAAPSAPLLRGSLRRNLSIGQRGLSDDVMAQALALVGLADMAAALERRIDPDAPSLDGWTQARLRLARAIAHGPSLLIVAEPALYFDPELPALLRAAAQASECGVIAAGPGANDSRDRRYTIAL
ncbi:MAG: ABC transporter transmembrane domain-containing protein [Hyphomonadaceae bacterium]|nr:ABC transporter transmembrane domain-containing protein [Hyphomonadaceae bacterium]